MYADSCRSSVCALRSRHTTRRSEEQRSGIASLRGRYERMQLSLTPSYTHCFSREHMRWLGRHRECDSHKLVRAREREARRNTRTFTDRGRRRRPSLSPDG
uniref:Uncharacterized protein n=1 Tax=Schistocephalus solidus TaxID=70667 RepID=A0A0X3NMP9_SCHSO